MKIIDRYTLKQVVVGFVLVLASMTALVWLTQSLRMIDMIVTRGVSAGVFLELTILLLPKFLQFLSPLVLFAVGLFTLIRMQADKELVVMQAVGMNAKDIMRPLFKIGIVLAGVGYVFSLFLIPMSNREMREMRWAIKNDIGHLLLQEGQFNTFKNGLTLYIKERLPDGQVRGVIAYEQKTPGKMSILSAPTGEVFQETDGIRVVVYDSIKQEYKPGQHEFSVLKSKKNTIMLPTKNGTDIRSTDPRELSLTELWQKSPADVDDYLPKWRKHKVELVKRFVQPLYNITFLYLIIFGVLSGFYDRRGNTGKILMAVSAAMLVQCLALAFEYASNKCLWFLFLLVLNVFTPMLFVYWKSIKAKLKQIKYGCALFVFAMYGVAQAGSIKMNAGNIKAPVDFEADEVSYNQKTGEMNASGNVILTQDTTVLKTDHISYNRNTDQITAPNQITIEKQDGTIAYTRDAVMSSQLNSIKTGPTDVHFYEGTVLKTDQMERVENGDSYLTNASYTPCDVCKGEAPLWQLRAKTVRHDSESKDLVYSNTVLEVKDIPVLYVPYWRMPDPTVKRRSGLLTPGIYSTHEMRRSLSLPFFIDIADNQNLVVRPILALNHMPLGIVTYQGLFNRGILNLSASATQDKDPKHNLAHIKGDFIWDLTNQWKLSGQIYRVSTDTYFRRYDLDLSDVDDTEPFLRSYLSAERFGNRNYFRAKAYSFQTIQEGMNHDAIPQLIPVIDYRYNTMPLNDMGLYGFTSFNSALYNARTDLKSNRLSVTQGFSMPYISSWGGTFDLTGSVRADGYSIDTGDDSFSGRKKNNSYDTGRIYPTLSLTTKYPMVSVGDAATQIFEPVAMVVVAPNGGNPNKIPNIDSLSFDFDDTNLFSVNRFAGYDRVEPGSRINYGFRWARFDKKTGRSVSALVGQSYNFSENEMMSELMGYNQHFSDYVGRLQIDGKYLSLMYRTRLDKETFKAKKSEIDIYGGTKALRMGLGYVMRDSYKIGDYSYDSREEIVYTLQTQLNKNWKFKGEYRYDLSESGEPVDIEGYLQYDNECVAVVFDVSKSYTSDRDYKGDVSYMVKVFFKTLGGI